MHNLIVDIPPVINSISAIRSPGGENDFYSEGDYWWPNPNTKDGLPYILRDGETNPGCFNEHRKLLINMAQCISSLTRKYIQENNYEYIKTIESIISKWFINPKTKMNSHLKYAQAIPGHCQGRGIGIIDTVHLAEVAVALKKLEIAQCLTSSVLTGSKSWFRNYLYWIIDHPYGVEERNTINNHSTCWYLQAATFAKLIDNKKLINEFQQDFCNILLPRQMDINGSFPHELNRTKPYSYSIFNLEIMTALCQIHSDSNVNLYNYSTNNGKSIKKGIEFLYPYLKDKKQWPYPKDIMYWNHWPIKHSCLFFCGHAYNNKSYLQLWEKLPYSFDTFEITRNSPIKTPELWLNN